jgi:hypothetical protein
LAGAGSGKLFPLEMELLLPDFDEIEVWMVLEFEVPEGRLLQKAQNKELAGSRQIRFGKRSSLL